MKIFLFIVLLFVLVTAYVVAGRPWLRKQPWAQGVFDKIEPIERVLYWNSETILFGRFIQFLGYLLTLLSFLGTLDLTPLMPFVPDKYEPMLKEAWKALPLVVSLLGWTIEKLRFDVTKPIEVVAMRTDAPPEVKEMAEVASELNAKAVEVAKEAGAV